MDNATTCGAVDSEGMVLDILLQTRRNARAAKCFFEGVSRPHVIVTNGLRSYNVILCDLLPAVEHRRSKYLNNRAENSHQPTRMQRFKSLQQAQHFLSVFDILYHYFHPKKHKLQADVYRDQLNQRYDIWPQLAA